MLILQNSEAEMTTISLASYFNSEMTNLPTELLPPSLCHITGTWALAPVDIILHYSVLVKKNVGWKGNVYSIQIEIQAGISQEGR